MNCTEKLASDVSTFPDRPPWEAISATWIVFVMGPDGIPVGHGSKSGYLLHRVPDFTRSSAGNGFSDWSLHRRLREVSARVALITPGLLPRAVLLPIL